MYVHVCYMYGTTMEKVSEYIIPCSDLHPVSKHVDLRLQFIHRDQHQLPAVVAEGECHTLQTHPQVEVSFVG